MIQRIIKHIPTPRDLQGSWLHRILGERLFCQHLWRFNKRQVAGGLALGTFVAFTPTMGVQMVIAGVAALLLRVNIPASLAACWITNPLSAPVIYGLEYQLGLLLVRPNCGPELLYCSGIVEHAIRLAKPLWLGSLVSAVLIAPLIYLIAIFGWEKLATAIQKNQFSTFPEYEPVDGSSTGVPFQSGHGCAMSRECPESSPDNPSSAKSRTRTS